MLVRMMADASATSHEHHGDIGDVDHRHAVMSRSARQLGKTKTLAGNSLRDLVLEPRRARRGAILVGNIELQQQASSLRDYLDLTDDICHRTVAVRVGRGSDIDGE